MDLSFSWLNKHKICPSRGSLKGHGRCQGAHHITGTPKILLQETDGDIIILIFTGVLEPTGRSQVPHMHLLPDFSGLPVSHRMLGYRKLRGMGNVTQRSHGMEPGLKERLVQNKQV